MSQETRQKRICELLTRRGECTIEELIRRLGVSGMTVRRDLTALAAAGKVIRTHGGAALADRVSFEFEFLNRVRKNQADKEAIAAVASSLIQDGQSLMLDSGTTTLELAKRLRGKRNLTVITTSLPIAAQLQFDPQIEVLLLGGYLRASSPDLSGALTEANLETIRADAAFLGADGVDSQGNVYQDSPELARMLTKMASSASRVYVVADHSKLGRTALWRYGSLWNWNALLTDSGADRRQLATLKKAGVCVIKA
ncbi:MAG: DeoR/GlpR transcriptional regulator [Pirellulales bacterium]|nr:DeoR/GlpR transcriptional regulator [Pirellulales bacterium]